MYKGYQEGLAEYLRRYAPNNDYEQQMYIPARFTEFISPSIKEDRRKVASMFATFFLSLITAPPMFFDQVVKNELRKRSIYEPIRFPQDSIVLAMGRERFDLLFLVPDFPAPKSGEKLEVLVINPSLDEMIKYIQGNRDSIRLGSLNHLYNDPELSELFKNYGWLGWFGIPHFKPYIHSKDTLWSFYDFLLNSDWVEVIESNQFNIFIANAPSQVYNAAVPVRPTPFSESISGRVNATIGVIARNADGQDGVTVARHAIAQPIVPNKTTVWISGSIGTVISEDLISDSCFVKFDNSNEKISQTPIKGVLKGRTPWQGEPVYFEGISSSRTDTAIDSWDRDILSPLPHIQKRIYTPPCTNLGDSGSALINDANEAVGFSICRTGLNEKLAYSTWIWAHSVFTAHRIN